MASSNDAYDDYTRGVFDTVELINENEDMKLNPRDVMMAISIKQLSNALENLSEEQVQQLMEVMNVDGDTGS